MFGRIARLVLDRPWRVAVVLLAVAATAMAGMPRLEIDFSARAFFGGGDPEAEFLTEHEARWGADDSTILVLAVSEDGTVLTQARLAELERIAGELEALDDVSEVLSLPTAMRVKRPIPGVVLPVPLSSTFPKDEARQEAWRQDLLADPLLVPALLAEDGNASAILARLTVGSDDIALVRHAVDRVQGVVQAHQDQHGMHLYIAGVPAVRGEIYDVIVGEQMKFVPLAILIMVTMLGWMFRSVYGVMVPLTCAVVPALMLFGTMGWAGEPIGLINQSYFTLIPIIAVADGVHMVTRYHEEIAQHDRRLAIIRAVGAIGAACLLTSTTTIVGFLSLNAASMSILRSFGTWAALGIGLAFLSVVTLMPLLLSRVKARPPVSGGMQAPWVERFLSGSAELAIRRPRAVLGVTALAILVGLGLSTRVVVDNHLTGALPPDHPAAVGNRLADELLGGVLTLEIALEDPDGQLASPENLRAMQTAAQALSELPEVRDIQSPATVVSYGSWLAGGPYDVPDSAGLIERLLRDDRLIDEGRQHARIVIRTEDVGGIPFDALAKRVQDLTGPALQGLSPKLTGTAYIAYRGINRVTSDLRASLSVAFVAIAILIGLLFKSLRIALISLVPNAVPLLAGYAMMGALGWQLDPAPAIVFTVALGIAVDDTIHLLARYREECLAGLRRNDAIRMAVRHSGRAVMVTTVLLTFAFGIDRFSTFPSNAIFGSVGAVIMAAALVCDILILPAMLALFEPE